MTKKHTRRALVTVVAAVSMMFAMVGSAFAQYPPAGFVTCDTTAAGATATCVIDGLDGESSVAVTVTLVSADVNAAAAPALASTVLAQDITIEGRVLFDDTVPVNDDGEATVVFDIPSDAQAGDQLVFTVEGSEFVGTAVLPVTAAGDAPPSTSPIGATPGDQLPRTGLEVGVLIAIAAAALVVGGGAVAAARRKGDASA